MKISYVDSTKENWFLISWTLSNKCNYRCHYCSDILHDGSSGHPNWDDVKNFVKNFKLPDKEICYRISGGEPTTWRHFVDLAKLVKEQNNYFTFLSNGSRSVDYFKEISHYSDAIILSYHPQYADVDHFVQIANAASCPIIVNLMMVPSEFDALLLVAEKLVSNSSNIFVWPKLILDKTSKKYITNQVNDYTDAQKDIIKNWNYFRNVDDSKIHRGEIALDGNPISANDIITKNLNNYLDWECWAGLHMLSIDMWGNIYRADCKQGGSLGTLSNYQLPSNTIVCKSTKCGCLGDIYLKKEKI